MKSANHVLKIEIGLWYEAQTAMILVWVIEVYIVSFSEGGGKVYKGPQPAALGLIGLS